MTSDARHVRELTSAISINCAACPGAEARVPFISDLAQSKCMFMAYGPRDNMLTGGWGG